MMDWDDSKKIDYYMVTATEKFSMQPDRFVLEYKKVQIHFKTVI